MLKFHSGQTEEALQDILQMKSNLDNDQTPITSEMYQQEGKVYADLGMYDNAIAAFTEAINRDPENK